ncbi:hypothetical protein RYH80_10275 [Halobaculum sp. MBLA0147]|uniref:hypothetical protein n=1 Tax=Halobaculum sp. MBLA0147 TaxID=3079934 RepID=UPI00352673C6
MTRRERIDDTDVTARHECGWQTHERSRQVVPDPRCYRRVVGRTNAPGDTRIPVSLPRETLLIKTANPELTLK